MSNNRTIYRIMILAIMGIILSLVLLKMKAVYYLTWNGIRGGLMPDLFESIWHARSDYPYSHGAIYPPFCYFILDFFNMFIQGSFTFGDRFDEIRVISKSCQGFKVAVVYSVIIFSLSYLMISKYFDKSIKEKLLVVAFFIASAPFIYMYERGNTVIIAMFFLAVFFKWYNSPNKIKTRIALMCFACAICMKIYPVVGGFLLLSEKKYKLILESILYSILLFFLPFYYTGGLDTFYDMINNIFYLSGETVTDTRGFGYGFKVSIQNTMLAICDRYNIHDTSWIQPFIIGSLAVLLLSAFIQKVLEYKLLAILLIMILIPPFSWIYNVVYLYFPFMILLNKEIKIKKDLVFLVLLLLCFIPLPCGFVFRELEGVNKISLSTFVCSWSMILMTIILALESVKIIFEKVTNIRNKMG